MLHTVAPLAMLQNMLSLTWLPNRNALLLLVGQRDVYLNRVPCARCQYRRRCHPPAITSSSAMLRTYMVSIQPGRNVASWDRSCAPGCRKYQVATAIPACSAVNGQMKPGKPNR